MMVRNRYHCIAREILYGGVCRRADPPEGRGQGQLSISDWSAQAQVAAGVHRSMVFVVGATVVVNVNVVVEVEHAATLVNGCAVAATAGWLGEYGAGRYRLPEAVVPSSYSSSSTSNSAQTRQRTISTDSSSS